MRRVLDIQPMAQPMLVPAPPGVVTLEWVRGLIGDWVCAAFRMEIDSKHWLTGWGDDNAWLKDGTQLNFIRWNDRGDPIGGRIIVTRETRDERGDLLPIQDSDAEMIAFRPCVVYMRANGVITTGPSRILLPVRPR